MTTETGSNPATPAPDATATPPADQQQPASPGLTISAVEEDLDIDALELQEAKAAAQAEDAAAATPGAQPAEATQPKPAPAGPDAPMIPKPRFDQVLDEANRAKQEAAYWRGQAEARAPAPAGGQPQQPAPQQTPEQRLAAIDTEVDALAKKFDDGDLTMAEFKAQERALLKQAETLRAETAPAAPASTGDSLYLNTLTAKLEEQYPMVTVFDQLQGIETEWKYVRDKAIDSLIARGVDFRVKSPENTYALREEIAKLSMIYVPALLGDKAKAAGITLPGQAPTVTAPAPAQQQQPAAQPGLSSEQRARLAKLDMRAAAPPDIAAMAGGAATTATAISDAQIEAMSDEEIGALPAAVRQRLLGITA